MTPDVDLWFVHVATEGTPPLTVDQITRLRELVTAARVETADVSVAVLAPLDTTPQRRAA